MITETSSTPETDALCESLTPMAVDLDATNAKETIETLLKRVLTKTCQLERQRDEAREIAGRLAECLQWLCDLQNGSPLPSYDRDWNRTLKDSRASLTDHENLSANWKA